MVVLIPIWITSLGNQSNEEDTELEKALDNPRVRRAILRLEVGGIIAGSVAVGFAVWGLYQAIYQSQLAEKALKEQRISSAWQILAQGGTGSVGQAYAITTLINDVDDPISGLKFGCPTDLVKVEFGKAYCKLPVQLSKLNLTANPAADKLIFESNFSHANLSETKFTNISFENVDFSGSDMQLVQFKNSKLDAVKIAPRYSSEMNFEKVAFWNMVLDVSNIRGKINNSSFVGVEFKYKPDEFGTNEAESLTVENAHLMDVVFTDFPFYTNKLRLQNFVTGSYENSTKRGILMPEGAYSTTPMFDISGTKFCGEIETADGANAQCWKDASQDFFDHAWFYVDNPPTGLDQLPFKPKLRIGCPRDKIIHERMSIMILGDVTHPCLEGLVQLPAISE